MRRPARWLALSAGAVALAGCAKPGAEGAGDGAGSGHHCVADPAQHFVGQTASSAIGKKIQRATGAAVFQWVPPNTAVTMDYRAERVRVTYDRAMVITAIHCG